MCILSSGGSRQDLVSNLRSSFLWTILIHPLPFAFLIKSSTKASTFVAACRGHQNYHTIHIVWSFAIPNHSSSSCILENNDPRDHKLRSAFLEETWLHVSLLRATKCCCKLYDWYNKHQYLFLIRCSGNSPLCYHKALTQLHTDLQAVNALASLYPVTTMFPFCTVHPPHSPRSQGVIPLLVFFAVPALQLPNRYHTRTGTRNKNQILGQPGNCQSSSAF